jgi:hypothetical protein
MKNWISKNFRNSTLKELKIPGTHHSSITKIIPETNYEKFKIIKYFPLLYPAITRVAVTQDMSIYEQLNSGIRFFDIRCALWENEIYTAHTFISEKLIDVLDQFIQFNKENPEEPFIIKISKDYNNYDFNISKAINLVEDKLQNIINTKYNAFGIDLSWDFNIDEIIKSGKPVIVIEHVSDISYIDTNNVTDKFNNIFDQINYLQTPSLVDIALTPTESDVLLVFSPYIISTLIILLLGLNIILSFVYFYDKLYLVNPNKTKSKSKSKSKQFIAVESEGGRKIKQTTIVFTVIIVILSIMSIGLGLASKDLKSMSTESIDYFVKTPKSKWDKLTNVITDFPTKDWIDYVISLNY